MYKILGKSALQTAVNTGMSLAIDDMVHDRNVRDAKNAEARAQKYWKDRFDIMTDYNSPEAVMERYRQAGLNPASAFEGGAVGQALDPSVNPNNPNSTRGPQVSPLDILGAEQSLANINLTKAETKNVEADTAKKLNEGESVYQTGYAAWVDNCLQAILDGNAKSVGGHLIHSPTLRSSDVKARYDIEVNDDGSVNFVNRGLHKPGDPYYFDLVDYEQLTQDGEFRNASLKWEFQNNRYGTYTFRAFSPTFYKEALSIVRDINLTEKESQDLILSFVNLRIAIMEGIATGKQADASMIQALAKKLETDFNFGDDFSTKWWIDLALKTLAAGTDILGSISELKKAFNPVKAKPKAGASSTGQ